ncbi:DUF6480 family protein [Streptomyces noursei]|uniref:DUF6480 family protein n=1 Tax=Streptomyces noursei TaxID=1971 RepID=UPI00045EE56A|nr:DUF6480 family protein [Streptomyces noursei]AIA06607.1 hypothetical protein DC74_6166 [Streptomyces noursei]MCZ0976071.1 DUF6480 family protein [Streptomyces noursei]
MPEKKNPPGETPPVEGSIAEAHEEKPDPRRIWEHVGIWPVLIFLGACLVALFFVARIFGW